MAGEVLFRPSDKCKLMLYKLSSMTSATDRRRDILETLRASASSMSIRDIANRLDLHPNTVRFHLQALLDRGRVARVAPVRGVPGRPPLMFRARPGMDPAGPRNYRLLADVLVTLLGSDPTSTERAVASGQAMGGRLAASVPARSAANDEGAADALVGILGKLGFAPERRGRASETRIGLRHCPFLELVEEHASVVCPVHLGLMQGVLTTLGAAVTVERLEPFVEPDLCVAHLGPAGAGWRSGGEPLQDEPVGR